MRTTMDIPEELLKEAMKLSGSPNKTATIKLALEGLVRKARLQAIKRYRGKVDLKLDLDSIRSRN